MCKFFEATWNLICGYWERVLFALVGLACLGFSFKFLYGDQITSASATFVVAFFSFIYANLSRFKKFKGMGFEAELWEDTQKEAANLIERLKNIVAIYTREIVMSSVNRMRLDGGGWQAHWALYDELVSQHDALGQKIDFTDLKRDMDRTFLFDICWPLASSLRGAIEDCKSTIQQAINIEFGAPITDSVGYGDQVKKLRAISLEADRIFERAEDKNIAQEILDGAKLASAALQQTFLLEPKFDSAVLQKLEKVAGLHTRRPLKITDELLAFAKGVVEQ